MMRQLNLFRRSKNKISYQPGLAILLQEDTLCLSEDEYSHSGTHCSLGLTLQSKGIGTLLDHIQTATKSFFFVRE